MQVVQKLLKVLAFSVSKFSSQIQHRIQLLWYYPLISLQAIFVYSIFYRSVCTYNEPFCNNLLEMSINGQGIP